MTEQILSSQDVDRFVSAAFIKRIVNCATSTNSGLENSSVRQEKPLETFGLEDFELGLCPRPRGFPRHKG